MEPGKGPDENLPFLIPLGPEGEQSPESSGGYTPVPVRPGPGAVPPPPLPLPPLEARAPEPRPPSQRPALSPDEPLVFLDPFGSPKTQPPPVHVKGAEQPPLPDPAGLVSPFSVTPASPLSFAPPPVPEAPPSSPPPAPLADFFLGKQQPEDKPFQPPALGEPKGPAPAPFQPPKLDGPVAAARKLASPEPLPGANQGAFHPPSGESALGTFNLGGLTPPPAPFKAPLEEPKAPAPFGAPPPVPGVPSLAAPPSRPPPAPVLKQPNPSAKPPGPVSRDAAIRPPHTAPPIRLPGSQPAPPKPLTGVLFDPGAPSKPAAASPAASSAPLRLQDLFEISARLPVATGKMLERCRAAPVPGVGPLLAHALAWALGSFVIRTALEIGQPSSIGAVTPSRLGVAVVFGLIGATIGIFISGGLAHGLGRLSGGTGTYARGLQVASLLAPLSTLTALMSPVDFLWWVPGALGAYLVSRTIAGLYSAPIVQVSVVVGTITLMGIAAQYKARQFAERWRQGAAPAEAVSAAVQAAKAAGGLTNEQAAVLEQLQTQGQMGTQGNADPQAAAAAMESGLQMLQQATEEAAAAVQGPQAGNANSAAGAPLGQAETAQAAQSLMPLLGTMQQGRKLTPEQVRQLKVQGGAALERAEAALNDPKLTEGMSPGERRQFQQLQKATQAIFRAGKGGAAPSAAETQQLMREMQKMMQTYQEGNPPAGEPQQPRKRRRRSQRPPPEE